MTLTLVCTVPSYIAKFAADIFTVRHVIFGFGFGLAIFLSFLYSHLLSIEFLGTILIWSGLLGTVFGSIALVVIAQRTATAWDAETPAQHSSDEILSLKIFSYILVAASVLFFCMMVFLRKQINMSVQILALASTCINDMTFIVFTPFVNLCALVTFLVPCMIYMFYVASDGTFDTYYVAGVPVGKLYTPASGVIDRLWYLFFCFLWTMSWIVAMSSIVIAISCATWYFTEERYITGVNSFTVLRAYGTTIRYHWGTAAFGSLLIAVVELLRWYLLYLQKVYNRMPTTQCLVRWACCCVQCCLWCVEKFLKFISKNAYIQTAIHGSSFCTGCREAFYEIARNIFRVGAIHVVGGLALFIGKIFIVSITVSASFMYINYAYGNDINGIVGEYYSVDLV
jgi:choline transporter-like protein 2/4/5